MTTQPPTKSQSIDGSEPTVEISSDFKEGHFYRPPRVLGDYVLEDEIGRGGMGIVYLAVDQRLDRTVALKVLPQSSQLTSSKVSRFQLEARSAAQLNHEHIVPVYHVGYERGTHYFAMRLIEGHTIEKLIAEAKMAVASQSAESSVGDSSLDATSEHISDTARVRSTPRSHSVPQVSIDTELDLSLAGLSTSAHSNGVAGARSAHRLAVCVAKIGHDIADALHHAHQNGIIHRDIKPSNLMIDESHKVWVTDFGLAQLQGEEALTRSGEFVGTLRYMSPEQASGRRVFIDHRTDIYSLGVTLYEMATLQKACPGDTPQEVLRNLTFSSPLPVRKINPRLPKDFEAILCRATERNPAVRYQTAEEFASDLLRFSRGEPLKVFKPQRIRRVLGWLTERPGVAMTIAAFTCLVCVSSFAIAVLANHAQEVQRTRANLAEEVVRIREAQQLSAGALLMKDENPGMAIAAAIEGAAVAAGPPAENALRASIDSNHEVRTTPIAASNAGRLAVSPDGRLAIVCTNPFAYATGPKTAAVMELSTGKTLGLLESQAPITEAIFDPSSKYVLTNSTSYRSSNAAGPLSEVKRGELRLWDAQSLRLLKTLSPSPAMRISPANFSHDGRRVVLPSAHGSATIYELPGLEPVMQLPTAHNGPVIDAIFSHDDQRIATWAQDATAIAWDASDGKQLKTIPYRTDLPLSAVIAFTYTHDQLCVSGSRGTILAALNEKDSVTSREEFLIGCSSTDHWLYLMTANRSSVRALNLDTGNVEFECQPSSTITATAMSADGRTLALACGDTIELFDGRSGQQLADLRGHTDYITSIAMLDTRQQIVSISQDRTLRVWNKLSDLEMRTLPTRVEALRQRILAYDQSGKLAAIGNVRSPRTLLVDSEHPDLPGSQFAGSYQLVLSSGQLLTSAPGACWLWDVKTHRKIQSVELPEAQARTVSSALEISSRYVALLDNQQKLYLWDLQTNSLSRFTKTGESVHAMVKLADQLIVGMSSGELCQIVLPTLDRKILHRFSTPIAGVILSSTGKELLVTTINKDLVLWNLEDSKVETTISAVEQRVPALYSVADGRCLTHANRFSKSVKIWSFATQKMEKELPVEGVRDLVLSSDGKSALILTNNRTVLWYWDEDRVDTVIERACLTALFSGQQVLLIARPETATASAAGAESTTAELMVWDTDRRMMIRRETMAISADTRIAGYTVGKFWLSSRSSGVDVIDIQANRVLASVDGLASEIVAAQFTTAGDEIVTVLRDGNIYATRYNSGERRLIGNHSGPIQAAVGSKDRRLLLTADRRGDIWKWDLTTSSLSGKVGTQGQAARWLAISDSGNTAAALLGDTECLLIDLRTDTLTRHTADKNILDASLAADGSKLLLITGTEELEEGVADAPEQVAALIVGLGDSKPVSLSAKGEALEGLFLSGDKLVVLLTVRGSAIVYDAVTGNALTTIETQRPISRLLHSNSSPETIFTVSGHQISGWTIKGSPTSIISVPGLDLNRTKVVEAELARASGSPWYLVFANDRIVKVPVDPLAYAKQIAPRELTDRERKSILWSPSDRN